MDQSPDLSIRDLDRAVELEPLKAYRYASRAFIKDRLGDIKGALKDYEKAVELDPDDAISHNNKGLVEEKLGYHDQARQSYRKADTLDPNFTEPALSDKSTVKEMEPVDESVSLATYGKQLHRLLNSADERSDFKQFLLNLLRRINEKSD